MSYIRLGALGCNSPVLITEADAKPEESPYGHLFHRNYLHMRIPVKYKKQVLMPMKSSRIRKYIEQNKGKIRYDRKLKLHYLALLQPPSDTKTQTMILGVDPGSYFDGFSVVSADTHHCNYELLQRTKKGSYSIKKFMERRAMNRRIRRSRKWHRPIRFSNRSSKKMAPTIRANVDMRKWLINKLAEYYPITKVVVEDVKFNHFKSNKGASFSPVEQGKTELYKFISKKWQLELADGYDTHKLRIAIFGHDIKSKDKSDKRFEAHCIDSFVIAFESTKSKFKVDINSNVLFIEKIIRIRRCLTRLRPRRNKSKNNSDPNSFYRLGPGGTRTNYQKLSKKRNICRVKPAGIYSNHCRWIYIDNGFAVKSRRKQEKYGGTSILTYFKNNEFINRRIL